MTAARIDPRTRRNVTVLVLAQALLGAQMPVNFVLGGLAGQLLAPDPCLATLPISIIVLGSMLSAPALSAFMQRYGRAPGFALGAAGGGIGAGLCAWGLIVGSFPLFLAGSLLTGLYMSGQGFYRFAAADSAAPEIRPKVISWVMAAGLASAIIGPQLVKLTEGALAPIPFAGAYVAVVVVNIVGVFLFAFLDSPPPPRPKPGDAQGRSRVEMLKSPEIAVAIICGMVAYALMNLVMTSAPLAVVGCGFSTAHAADIVSAHVLAMFGPSFFTGHLIARFGARRIVGAGLVILALAGVIGIAGVTLAHFYAAMILLGLGWNFGYIGATAMLTAAHTVAERGRAQGMNDFFVFGLVAVASFASGGLMNCSGGDPATGWIAVNLAMIPLLALAISALIWLARIEPRPRPAE